MSKVCYFLIELGFIGLSEKWQKALLFLNPCLRLKTVFTRKKTSRLFLGLQKQNAFRLGWCFLILKLCLQIALKLFLSWKLAKLRAIGYQ